MAPQKKMSPVHLPTRQESEWYPGSLLKFGGVGKYTACADNFDVFTCSATVAVGSDMLYLLVL